MKPFIGLFGLFSSFADDPDDDSFFSFAGDAGGGDDDAAAAVFVTAAGVKGALAAARRGECCSSNSKRLNLSQMSPVGVRTASGWLGGRQTSPTERSTKGIVYFRMERPGCAEHHPET